MATSLARADHRQVVHVDARGQVRSPARYRAILVGSHVAIGGLSAALVALAASTFGIAGAVGAGLFVAWGGFCLTRLAALRRAGDLMVDRRHAEAESLLRRVAAAPLVPRGYRAIAELYLGQLLTREGRFEEAVERLRAAQALHQGRQRTWTRSATVYSLVVALVSLGRLAEARHELATRPEEQGDYLRLARWTAELYLWFAEGAHPLGDEQCHARARVALETTVASALLGLTAWAFHARGDADMAAHLLGEAFERPTTADLEKPMPELFAWMASHK
jgi:hypothetical protein